MAWRCAQQDVKRQLVRPGALFIIASLMLLVIIATVILCEWVSARIRHAII